MLRGMGDNQVKLPLYSVKHTQVDEEPKNIRLSKSAEQTGVGGEGVDVFGNPKNAKPNTSSRRHCPKVKASCTISFRDISSYG